MSEHKDPVTRALHITGTSIVSLILLLADKQRLLLALVAASAIGMAMCGANQGMPNGALEMGVLLASYLGINRWLGGNTRNVSPPWRPGHRRVCVPPRLVP